MRYFSGFSLRNEAELFNFWLPKSDYTVVGFSYGAIKAVEYLLTTDKRVDRLILLSPAYFNTQSDTFKKMQLLYFKKDPQKYIETFLHNISSPCDIDLKRYLNKEDSAKELKELLYYQWSVEKLKRIQERGTTIEVILGGEDKIIDAKATKDFFEHYTTLYFIKEANHILRRKDD